MKIKAVLNRDGGTFKTTDMQTYCETATRAFAAKGHDLDCDVVAGDEVVQALEQASKESDLDALLAGGGDGTISTAAGIAWEAGVPLGIIPAGTMNLFARSLKLPLDIWQVLDTLVDGRSIQHVVTIPEGLTSQQIVDRHAIRLRVYERGAGETLSCGTGACAAAVTGIARGLLDSPVTVHTRGGELEIAWAGKGRPVLMTGPARTVFEGEIEVLGGK